MELWERVEQAWNNEISTGPGANATASWKAATAVAVQAERERCLLCVTKAEAEHCRNYPDAPIGQVMAEARVLIRLGTDPAAKQPGQVLAEAMNFCWADVSRDAKKIWAEREAAVRAHYCKPS